MPTPNEIRQQVMKERGIVSFKPKKKQRRIQAAPRKTIDVRLKTPLMRYLEIKKGLAIEDVLVSGSLAYVARELDDEVDVSTISKWIKRLKLRYTQDNLPTCEGCGRHGPACEGGVCYILVELGLYDLMLLKRKELLDA